MKGKNIGRIALAMGMSVATVLGTASCSRDYTVAYVYTTSAQNASVSAFAVDYQAGVLTQIAGSPFTAGIGRNPDGLVASRNGKNLYVISHDDPDVTEFAIGTDGKLYGQNTYNTTGTFPTAIAIDTTGKFLYVTFTYQTGFTPASPGPGGITVFPINSDGTLNNSGKFQVNVGFNPVSIAVSQPFCAATPLIAGNATCTGINGAGHQNVFVYVVDQEPASNGTIVGFAQNTATGGLTLLAGSAPSGGTITGYHAGIAPTSIAIDPTATYAYVSDKTANQIYGYRIANSTTGALTALSSSPYTTGLYPLNITIDPRGKYLLSANYNAQSVSSFSINIADGSLGANSGSGNTQVATGPTCVAIEPALGIYVFTSNSIDGSVSGLQMNANTGQLSAVPNTPFPTGQLPSCVTAVANGSHTQSIVNP
ncbi:MAG TPA: beta-propeller fold lactonase family protein [Acidobacteriaceae bacterium]|jgi:6-phosphogluconolactonase (cycloisomerase 2 family)